MNRIVVRTKLSSDGNLHLDLAVGAQEADTDVLVTVEPVAHIPKRTLLASDLVQSGLVGIWAERTDIENSLAFARRLRDRAQTRRQDP
jgi:hypothetical protein